MLSVGMINGFDNRLKKRDINFTSGSVLTRAQKTDFARNIIGLHRDSLIIRLKSAKELLPVNEGKAATRAENAIKGFDSWLSELEDSPESSIGESISHGFHVENEDSKLATPLIRLVNVLEGNKKYEGFLKKLTKNLYTKNVEKEVAPKVVVEEPEIKAELPVKKVAEPQRSKKSKLDFKFADNLKYLAEKAGIDNIEGQSINNAKSRIVRKTRADKLFEAEAKLREQSFELGNVQSDFAMLKSDRIGLLEDKHELMENAPYMFIESQSNKVRDKIEKQIKTIINEHVKPFAHENTLLIAPQAKPDMSTFKLSNGRIDKKAYKKACAKLVRANQQQVQQQQGRELAPQYLAQVKQKRRNLALFNKKFPNVLMLNKKIEQVKDFLYPGRVFKRELAKLKKQSFLTQAQHKQLIDSQYLLEQLKERNTNIWSSLVRKTNQGIEKIDFVKEREALLSKKPKEEDYGADCKGSFKSASNTWEFKMRELHRKQLLAQEFGNNASKIGELESNIAAIKAMSQKSEQFKSKKMVLQNQKKRVENFIQSMIGEQSGRDSLKAKKKELEAQKQLLIKHNKSLWTIDSQLSLNSIQQNHVGQAVERALSKYKMLSNRRNQLDKAS